MPTLYELADVMRSKNAGPFLLTVDLLFYQQHIYDHVCKSSKITAEEVAKRYNIDKKDILIIYYPAARAIKITMHRPGKPSGSPGDRDVYGAQQHAPLMNLQIPEIYTKPD